MKRFSADAHDPRRRVEQRMTGRERVTHAIKSAVSHALYYAGVLQLWQAIVLRRKAVVLMYHRVLTDEERSRSGSHPGIVVARETFAWQMSLLKRRFVVLSLAEFYERLERRRPFPSSSCLITFDDGWRDNFTNALPILKQQQLPAVIFLPVNYIGQRRLFWREALTQLLSRVVVAAREEPARRSRFHELLAPLGLERILDLGEDDSHTAIVRVVSAQTDAKTPVSDRFLTALANELGLPVDAFADADGFMNWDQVVAMSRQGIAFGGHGAEHRLLTELSSDEALNEIRGSIEALTGKLGETVPTFSYPNGCWAAPVVDQVNESGFRLAFTTQPGFVSCHDDRFTLRRFNIHEDATDTPAMFLARIVGLF